MNLPRVLLLCFVVSFGQTASAQKGDHVRPKTSIEMVRDITSLLSRHFPTKAELRLHADRLARAYSNQLRVVGKKVSWVESEAKERFGELEWQEKLSLAMELWRIHSSLDLLCLASPDVCSELTGMDLRQLQSLIGRFARAEARLQKALPLGR